MSVTLPELPAPLYSRDPRSLTPNHFHNAEFSVRSVCEQEWPPKPNRLSPQGDGFQHVRPPPDPAIDVDLSLRKKVGSTLS